MEILEKAWLWITGLNWDWKWFAGFLVGAVTLIWRVGTGRRGRRRDEREKLSRALDLVDELIHSHTPNHMLSDLTSDVSRSSELLAEKSARQREIVRNMQGIALQLPAKKFKSVAQDIYAITRSLSWDEWRAIQLKIKLAGLINPQLVKDTKDEHALDDDDWDTE